MEKRKGRKGKEARLWLKKHVLLWKQGALAAFRRIGVVVEAPQCIPISIGTEEPELASARSAPHQSFLAHVDSSRLFTQVSLSGLTDATSDNLEAKSGNGGTPQPAPVPCSVLRSPETGILQNKGLQPRTPPQSHEGPSGTHRGLSQQHRPGLSQEDRAEGTPASDSAHASPQGASPCANAGTMAIEGSSKQEGRKKGGAGDVGGLQLREDGLLRLADEYRNERKIAQLLSRIEGYIVG